MRVHFMALSAAAISVLAGCSRSRPSLVFEPRCDTTRSTNSSWVTYAIGSQLEVTAPYGMRRDSSTAAALAFYHGGARWLGAGVVLEWSVSNRAYAGVLHDSLEARLARTAGLSPPDSLPPSPNGWVVRYVLDSADAPLTIQSWAMPPGTHDIIYYITISACAQSGIETALRTGRSLRLRA